VEGLSPFFNQAARKAYYDLQRHAAAREAAFEHSALKKGMLTDQVLRYALSLQVLLGSV